MTTTPTRIQLSRKKGWRMPENTSVVDRRSKWGNPFRVGKEPSHLILDVWGWSLHDPDIRGTCDTIQQTVIRFRRLIENDGHYQAYAQLELRGKNLACWCGKGPCHADVLLQIANEGTP